MTTVVAEKYKALYGDLQIHYAKTYVDGTLSTHTFCLKITDDMKFYKGKLSNVSICAACEAKRREKGLPAG